MWGAGLSSNIWERKERISTLVPLLVVRTTRTLSTLLHEEKTKPSLFKGVVEYLHLVVNHLLADISF